MLPDDVTIRFLIMYTYYFQKSFRDFTAEGCRGIAETAFTAGSPVVPAGRAVIDGS
jgi:hypothetical protein